MVNLEDDMFDAMEAEEAVAASSPPASAAAAPTPAAAASTSASTNASPPPPLDAPQSESTTSNTPPPSSTLSQGLLSSSPKNAALAALNAFGRSPPRPLAPRDDPVFDLDRALADEEEEEEAAAASARVTQARPSSSSAVRKRVVLEDEFDFDLERELAMEEEMEQPPLDFMDEDEEDELEALRAAETQAASSSKGKAPAPAPATAAAAKPSAPAESSTRARLDAHGIGLRRGPGNVINDSVASSSSAAASVAAPVKPRPSLIGKDGLPKYMPAGLFAATTLDGTPIRFERRRRMHGWQPAPPHYGTGVTGLLGRPAHRVLEAAEAAAAQAVVDRDERNARIAAQAALKTTSAALRGDVWAEKYRPQRFTDLLGDDRTHRDVLAWLKQWDLCVFKRQDKRKRVKGEEVAPAATPAFTGYGAPGGAVPYVDAWGRPSERVLLISGPPGLGKTTLAHVVAKACGYAVYELNASDARTSGAVEDRIKMACESGAAVNDARPTCVIIDEIDGATGGGGAGEGQGFIRSLCKLIEDGKGQASKKSKKKKRRPLLRPIICICNDLYAPALRPLRPMAKLIRLAKPTTNHLVARLRLVCEKEALSTDSRTLSLLAELTDNDVRSCLNALQMARARSDELRVGDLKDGASGLGVKDGGSSTNKVWELLFRTASPKERARGAVPKDMHEMYRRIVHEVSACGEPERILAGCFEHYPLLRAQDDGWWRYNAAHDWMHWNESLVEKGWQLGTHELAQYSPWSFVSWHTLFANTINELPAFPRADYENHLKRTAFDEVAAEVYALLPVNLRIAFGKESVVTELGPSLMRMLSPDLRPVNGQVVRPEEKTTLTSVVSIMLGLNLSMVQDRTEEGTLIYRLDPAVDAFVQYEGKRSKEVAPARYAIRHAISREMELAKTRIRAAGSDAVDLEGAPIDYKALAAKAAAGAIAVYKRDEEADKAALAAQVAQQKSAAVDFFGRPVVPRAIKEKVPVLGEDEAAAIRRAEKEAQIEKEKAAKAAPVLPSLLMERRAARLAAEGAANPHVKTRPAAVSPQDGSAPKRAKV